MDLIQVLQALVAEPPLGLMVVVVEPLLLHHLVVELMPLNFLPPVL
jgi:hypothetical protein